MLSRKTQIVSIGLAMFSMFFGAGNVTFPIRLGQYAGDKNIFAILGLLITAVFVPFVCLISSLSFNGNYKEFFSKMGEIPGMLVSFLIIALIGPFNAIPRCITLSYSTMSLYYPQLPLVGFSFIAIVLVFVMSIKKSSVIDLLGFILTPLLLISLSIIIFTGFMHDMQMDPVVHSGPSIFFHGLKEGYNTMDLFAAIFFAIVIIPNFKKILGDNLEQKSKEVGSLAVKSSLIGMFCLSAIYVGMSFVAAFHSKQLAIISMDKQLGYIAHLVLGPYAGLVANLAVSLACLTTAITLSIVFAEFIKKEIFGQKLSYGMCLFFTCVIAFFFSMLGFNSIVHLAVPVLVFLCPSIIVLSLTNLIYKYTGFDFVKIAVYATLAITTVAMFIS